MKACIVAFGSIAMAAGASAPASAAARSARTHKKPFSLNVCAIPSSGELAAAEISAPCHESKTLRTPVRKSRVGGTAGSVQYGAHWSASATALAPSHSLSIIVIHELGSGRGVEIFRKEFRLKVIGHGLEVSVRKGRASEVGETSSCVNPPTGDCTFATFLAISGDWVFEAFLRSYPPTIPGTNELETPSEDDPQDLLQEEAIRPALSSIGASVVAKV
jgi:hypothetical protein